MVLPIPGIGLQSFIIYSITHLRIFQKMCSKSLSRGQWSPIQLKKNRLSHLWKRRKSSLSTLFYATGMWGSMLSGQQPSASLNVEISYTHNLQISKNVEVYQFKYKNLVTLFSWTKNIDASGVAYWYEQKKALWLFFAAQRITW